MGTISCPRCNHINSVTVEKNGWFISKEVADALDKELRELNQATKMDRLLFNIYEFLNSTCIRAFQCERCDELH